MWNTPYALTDGRAGAIWVSRVKGDIDGSVAATTHLFQQVVDKVADVRLTVVGDRMWAVRMDGSPGLDWRCHYDALSYTVIETPIEVATGVRAFLESFELVFGALDFGIDSEGGWLLYECNPNGQWAWFGESVTSEIASALADQLQFAEAP